MVFSSLLFLFLFLPIVLSVYFLLPNFLKNGFLLLASLLFYAWGEGLFVVIMLLSILFNYGMGILVHSPTNRRVATTWLGIATFGNLFLLGAYKYANFIVDNLNILLTEASLPPIRLDPVHLPIGISFFTFQALSYVIDVYRREAPVQKNPINLALYIALFPQLIAGPIVRYHDVALQILSRRTTLPGFAYGVRRFTLGIGKKVLIANVVGDVADRIFGLPVDQLNPGVAWLGTICYTLQIYFDFSGYSDMAIGLGHMFGFRFLENFNYPYISRSIREFWRRWHISLSTWFRDYLYIPLGGNRHSSGRTYFNLVLVFFLCGLWHGSSWTFVVWGLYHGFFLVLERTGWSRFVENRSVVLQHLYTILIVMGGWVLFRCESLRHAAAFFQALVGQRIDLEGPTVAFYWTNELAWVLIIAIIGSTPILPRLVQWYESIPADMGSPAPALLRWTLVTLGHLGLMFILIYSAMSLTASTHNPFIYFRF